MVEGAECGSLKWQMTDMRKTGQPKAGSLEIIVLHIHMEQALLLSPKFTFRDLPGLCILQHFTGRLPL